MGDHCVCPTGTTGVDCAEQPKLEVGGGGTCYALRDDKDFGRLSSIMFLDRLLSSKFRTADPSQADYFFVPQVGFGNRMKSLEYVQTAFETHWNRKQGKDHIMIGTHDAGAHAYFQHQAGRGSMLQGREGNRAAENVIFLSPMGLQSGMKRGGYTGNHIVVRLS
ncbi:hypothetical protein CYMTET_38245 [Cymbomonas tetramitiformis]|uniref:EGF-like domain-containing protein n=1 Tax=Cymbomonas tetramitiformis TaxID=36881 RepID=A0AAE0F548_9CHLO|nr:hypothetical protein CYMTET_38245 [Cymbomonas tetramitiformis]